MVNYEMGTQWARTCHFGIHSPSETCSVLYLTTNVVVMVVLWSQNGIRS